MDWAWNTQRRNKCIYYVKCQHFYWSIHCGLCHFAVTDYELGNNSVACRVFRCTHKMARVCPSVSMERLGSQSMDIHELYMSIFWKSVEKMQVSLISDKNNWHFTWRPIYFFDHIMLSSSQDEKCFRQML